MVLPVTGRYLELMRAGRKTSTIRLWDVCTLKPEQRITFTNYRPGVSVRARCTSVEQAEVRALTDAHAKADGFESLDELLAALRKHYAALAPDRLVWIIHFKVLNDSDQSAPARA